MFAGTPSNNYDQTAKSLGLISESLKDSGVSISGVSTSIVRVFAVWCRQVESVLSFDKNVSKQKMIEKETLCWRPCERLVFTNVPWVHLTSDATVLCQFSTIQSSQPSCLLWFHSDLWWSSSAAQTIGHGTHRGEWAKSSNLTCWRSV